MGDINLKGLCSQQVKKMMNCEDLIGIFNFLKTEKNMS